MNYVSRNALIQMFYRSSQLSGIFFLAMLLGGPKVQKQFSVMAIELTRVNSTLSFAEWLIRSQCRLIQLTNVAWKPISVFSRKDERSRPILK